MVDTKKPRKRASLRQEIRSEVTQRTRAEIESQKTQLKTGLRSKLESLLPAQLRWLLPTVEGYRLGTGEAAPEAEAPLVEAVEPPTEQDADGEVVLYPQYRCATGNPLSCRFARPDDRQGEKGKKPTECAQCLFPLMLAAKSDIQGTRGRYRIEGFLRRRGLGRLYYATRQGDGQRVMIKEYLLPTRSFSPEEIQRHKQVFEQVAGIACVDGRSQDYRLVAPWDAIADAELERCYLITWGDLDTAPTLATHLRANGAMPEGQVRHVLNQVLQSLDFLHRQKARLPGGRVQGLAHGNLSLESLLILKDSTSLGEGQEEADVRFHVYLCDLEVWEKLFDPFRDFELWERLFGAAVALRSPAEPGLSTRKQPVNRKKQDLRDLARVGFYLLKGDTENPETRLPWDLEDPLQWEGIRPPLQKFLRRLLSQPSFESAEEARQELLRIPEVRSPLRQIEPEVDEADEPVQAPWRWFWYLLGGLGILLLAWLLWQAFTRRQPAAIAQSNPALCLISDVPHVPRGKFRYSFEDAGDWTAIERQSLVSQPVPLAQTASADRFPACDTRLAQLSAKPGSLSQILQKRQPRFQIAPFPQQTFDQAIAQVQNGDADFAIASITQPLAADLVEQAVAYDGVAIVVPFSYARRSNSLPKGLNGKLTIDQLRQLYTRRITNWQDLGGPDLDVRLYAPADPVALRLFEQRVLKTPDEIRRFRDLQRQQWITRLPVPEMLRASIRDFEDSRKGAIAFAPFSQVFGQCSVYPLALIETGDTAVQALVQEGDQPIDPDTDLCRNKGSYRPDGALFKTQRYPLAYPLAVVYSRDNSRPAVGAKMADLLQTREGQSLLLQAGMVPLVD